MRKSTTVWPVVHEERRRLVVDLAELPADRWETPSLCPGWDVHDVVAHLVDTARTGRLGFVRALVEARMDFDRANENGIAREKREDPRETLEALREAADLTLTPPANLATRLAEAIVHGEDIRRPLGIAGDYPDAAVGDALAYQLRTPSSFGGGKERARTAPRRPAQRQRLGRRQRRRGRGHRPAAGSLGQARRADAVQRRRRSGIRGHPHERTAVSAGRPRALKPADEELMSRIHAERAALAEDLAHLTEDQWHHASLCGLWDVEEVVAHLVAGASLNQWQWLRSIIGARFRPAVHNQRRLVEHRGATPAETLQRFRAVIGSRTLPSNDLAAYLGEVVVHAQDIRRPLGLERVPKIETLTPVAEFFARRDFTVSSRKLATGLELRADDGPFSAPARATS